MRITIGSCVWEESVRIPPNISFRALVRKIEIRDGGRLIPRIKRIFNAREERLSSSNIHKKLHVVCVGQRELNVKFITSHKEVRAKARRRGLRQLTFEEMILWCANGKYPDHDQHVTVSTRPLVDRKTQFAYLIGVRNQIGVGRYYLEDASPYILYRQSSLWVFAKM